MKLWLLITSVIIFTACTISPLKKISTVNYSESRDTGHANNAKILQGVINKSILVNDTAFKWYADNYKYAYPNADAVTAFKKNKEKFSVIVFGGTWCHDTQNLLPLFFKLIEQSGYSEKKVYLLGVDRKKSAGNDLNIKYKIEKVPTFIIVDKNGNEFGRVVEYGNMGAIDKELGEIVNKIP